MPLLIAVLIIIVLFVVISEKKRHNTQAIADQSFECRKTNARLERSIMTSYLIEGFSFNDAFAKTQSTTISLGFAPCIPQSAYDDSKSVFAGHIGCEPGITFRERAPGIVTSYVYSIDQYDSKAVQVRRELHEKKWRKTHPNEDTPRITDEELYSNFPVNALQVSNENCRKHEWGIVSSIGEYFTHGRLGTCEIIGYVEPPLGTSLMYQVKIVATGMTATVAYNDKTITKIKKLM